MHHMFQDMTGLLDGFAFANDLSRENALWARIWALQAKQTKVPQRFPLVVISGPVCSGKTELARRLGATFFFVSVRRCH
jgi:hypothetical protein